MLKETCRYTFTVSVVNGFALCAALVLKLLHLLSLTVVKLQQHVDQFISCLLHQ